MDKWIWDMMINDFAQNFQDIIPSGKLMGQGWLRSVVVDTIDMAQYNWKMLHIPHFCVIPVN